MKFLKSNKKLILVIVLAVVLIAGAYFTYYVSDYYHADSVALAALQSTDNYTVVDNNNFIYITPDT